MDSKSAFCHELELYINHISFIIIYYVKRHESSILPQGIDLRY